MTTIRRIYVYLLAFAGLAILALGCANLLQTLLDVWLAPAANLERSVRQNIALFGAATVVALPMWLAHWLWAERRARTDPTERASVLRRLYVYAILLGSALIAAGALRDVLEAVFIAVLGPRPGDPLLDRILRPVPFLVIASFVWLGHLNIAARDRAIVGEVGGSATLRRWYVYAAALIGFGMLLAGATGVLEDTWRVLTTTPAASARGLADPLATALVGLGLWLLHWGFLAKQPDDERATLRGVYLFVALATTVFGALLGLSQILYYAVGRLLGVPSPGGVSGDLLPALAGPASLSIVFGAAWLYQRQAIARHTAHEHDSLQRLYAYLVSLIALAVFAVGLSGVLWTLVDVNASTTWRDQMALFATAVVVGLPVWLAHWGPRAAAQGESRSLARRLYVYLTLIVSMLALLGSAAAAVYRVFEAVLATQPEAGLLIDLGHALAIATVAGCVAVYHWRVGLRSEPTPTSDRTAFAGALE